MSRTSEPTLMAPAEEEDDEEEEEAIRGGMDNAKSKKRQIDLWFGQLWSGRMTRVAPSGNLRVARRPSARPC